MRASVQCSNHERHAKKNDTCTCQVHRVPRAGDTAICARLYRHLSVASPRTLPTGTLLFVLRADFRHPPPRIRKIRKTGESSEKNGKTLSLNITSVFPTEDRHLLLPRGGRGPHTRDPGTGEGQGADGKTTPVVLGQARRSNASLGTRGIKQYMLQRAPQIHHSHQTRPQRH